MCEKDADKPVALMEARHVRALRDERSDRPGAANTRLKALKALFVWACEEKPELAPQNPALGVRKIKYATNYALKASSDMRPFFPVRPHVDALAAALPAHLSRRSNDGTSVSAG